MLNTTMMMTILAINVDTKKVKITLTKEILNTNQTQTMIMIKAVDNSKNRITITNLSSFLGTALLKI